VRHGRFHLYIFHVVGDALVEERLVALDLLLRLAHALGHIAAHDCKAERGCCKASLAQKGITGPTPKLARPAAGARHLQARLGACAAPHRVWPCQPTRGCRPGR
jgi:hypothetical protein